MSLLGQDRRRRGLRGLRAERLEHRVAGGLHRRGRARMELEVAELALDDEDPRLSLGVLEHDVGERLDIEPGGDLDHAGRHPRARQAPAHPGAEVAHGLRLQLVDEDAGA